MAISEQTAQAQTQQQGQGQGAGHMLPPHAQKTVRALGDIEIYLNRNFLSRSAPIRGALIGLLSRRDVYIVGGKGTAKSSIVETLFHKCLPDARYFGTQLSAFDKPEKIFGPISMQALAQDKQLYKVDNYLPCAEVANIDEFGNANGSTQKALQRVLNEREYEMDGSFVGMPQFIFLIGTSNSIPTDDERTDLDALWDRFAQRYLAEEVDDSDLARILDMKCDGQWLLPPYPTVAIKDVRALFPVVDTVPVPPAVRKHIVEIRAELRNHNITPSTRRFNWLLEVMRANAVLDGRAAVDEDDLMVSTHVLWEEAKDRRTITEIVARHSSPYTRQCQQIDDKVQSIVEEWQKADKQAQEKATKGEANLDVEIGRNALSVNQKLIRLIKEAQGVRDSVQASGRSASRAQQTLDNAVAIRKQALSKMDVGL